MLLRRITEHVKNQNWFAVWIDLVIVIIGVFIGIQVANWNDERAEKTQDRALLLRLQRDFTEIVEFGERLAPKVADQPATTWELISAIRNDEKLVLDDHGARLLSSPFIVIASYKHSPAYQEMIEAGTLSRLSDPALADALSAYNRGLEADDRLVERQLEVVFAQVEIARGVQFDYAPDSKRYSGIRSFDWEILKGTEPNLQAVLGVQHLRADWYQEILVSAREVLRLVNKELGGM